MRPRGTAVAIALLGAALAAAGCGLGPGEEVGEVSLTITRDYGAAAVVPRAEDAVTESDTVMRVLERSAEIETRFGSGFVAAIDGVAEVAHDGRRFDWFFYVNGVESPVGAADFGLEGGEAIWWDYRDWSAAARVPVVVGAWPRPLRGGYEGEEHPVALECEGAGAACGEVGRRLRAAGAALAPRGTGDAIRVLVGPWARLRRDPAAALLEDGPQASGVFVEPVERGGEWRLLALGEDGEPARELGPGAGLVAATRRYGAPPVWLVTGATRRGVQVAAGLLDAAHLRDHYAVASEGDEETPLPVER
jgi:Domain of unknown function (DUF4430)